MRPSRRLERTDQAAAGKSEMTQRTKAGAIRRGLRSSPNPTAQAIVRSAETRVRPWIASDKAAAPVHHHVRTLSRS